MNSRTLATLLLALAMMLLGATDGIAQCVRCDLNFSTGCWRCSSGNQAANCILGSICIGTGPTEYNACAHQGSCPINGPEGELTTILFDTTLISDLSQTHPGAAEVLTWINDNGGLSYDEMTFFTSDPSTEDRTDYIQYQVHVTMDETRPAFVELTAVKPKGDDPPLGTVVFEFPHSEMADASYLAQRWSER